MITIFENTKKLFAANHWAMEILLTHIPDEYLDQDFRSSFPSIRKTFNHIWDANTAWYYRFTFNQDDPWVSGYFKGDNETWRKEILRGTQLFIDLLETKEPAYLDELLTYKTRKGDMFTQQIYQLLHHVVNHSTMHRGQIISMARNLGYEGALPSTDFSTWYRLYDLG